MRYLAALCLGLVLLLPRSVFASTTTSALLPESPLTQTATSTAPEAFQPEQYGLAAAYAMTPKTRRELYAWNADKVWPLASLTKLVAASVWQGKTVPWRAIMTIQKRDEVGGGRLRVPVGTRIRFEDLWYASITASANNAAMMVAARHGSDSKTVRRAHAKGGEEGGGDLRRIRRTVRNERRESSNSERYGSHGGQGVCLSTAAKSGKYSHVYRQYSEWNAKKPPNQDDEPPPER